MDYSVSDLRLMISGWALLHPDLRVPETITVQGLMEINREILRGHFNPSREIPR